MRKALPFLSFFLLAGCASLSQVKEPPPLERSGIKDEVVRLAEEIGRESLKVVLTRPKARTHYEKALDYVRRARLLVEEAPHPLWDRSFMREELSEIERQIRFLARRGILDVWKREVSGEDPDRLMLTEILSSAGVKRSGEENFIYSTYEEEYSKYPLHERVLKLAEELTDKERNHVRLADVKGTPSSLMLRYLTEVRRNLEAIVKDGKSAQEVDYRLYGRIESLASYVREVERRFGAEVRESGFSLSPESSFVAEIEKLSREADVVNRALKLKREERKKERKKVKEKLSPTEADLLIEEARKWR